MKSAMTESAPMQRPPNAAAVGMYLEKVMQRGFRNLQQNRQHKFLKL